VSTLAIAIVCATTIVLALIWAGVRTNQQKEK
jgi:hypothetical protein